MTADIANEPLAPQIWHWQGYPIVYRHQGTTGTPLLLIHGFGASSLHWRKNIPVLAAAHRVYAIDLLGFGGSAKPAPHMVSYTFETWATLVLDFCHEVIGAPTVLIGNSIGCVVALQAAVFAPEWVRQLILLNCSLRQLNERKRQQLPWYRQWGTTLLQRILGNRAIGTYFFHQIAQPRAVRRILHQAYGDTTAVTEELVDILLGPAQDQGAADVFLAFVRYSQGPVPEDLLPLVTCPTYFLWGAADPWEAIAEGQQLAAFRCVREFVPLAGVGHCPQDEAPAMVNAYLQQWLATPS
ncbi:alpha/beta fold hydrolase [Synechococcus sp. PCC 6717]|jgi:pimeloyl-ACP methyl ester carboxylesterase|uniref:Alpha/beta hydrolase n=1 Tax=Parathermosynechococcus lividus PCC 6715 TaxID=1917166 RepID=A0A2D2PZ89_PARLV|nr:alpha/beta fold hydrolase [Thermostichus lividus]ATS17551.1 alpha/beta hydrolase [Thermostichus lividus PCC 6715]MCI3280934.1 alpha/beta fold hydrolase [Synechococcus sp. PCC 6717]